MKSLIIIFRRLMRDTEERKLQDKRREIQPEPFKLSFMILSRRENCEGFEVDIVLTVQADLVPFVASTESLLKASTWSIVSTLCFRITFSILPMMSTLLNRSI